MNTTWTRNRERIIAIKDMTLMLEKIKISFITLFTTFYYFTTCTRECLSIIFCLEY